VRVSGVICLKARGKEVIVHKPAIRRQDIGRQKCTQDAAERCAARESIVVGENMTVDRKPRILFVSAEGSVGGAETSLLLLVKCLRNYCSISVACPSKGRLGETMSQMGVDCHLLPTQKTRSCLSPTWFFRYVIANYRLIKLICIVKPDIVHANSIYALIFSAMPAIVTRRKLILHARDMVRSRCTTWLCSWCCDRIIAISNAVRNHLIRTGVAASKIEVVYNGVEISSSVKAIGSDNAFDSCAARRRGGITFANIGQFVPWKKQMLFLQAAHEITDRLPHAKFILVGDDLFGRNSDCKDRLLNYLKRLDLPERFVHIGWQEDMTKVWENVDCLVHTADREPFGRIIIEAMAARVPVIAVDSAGPSEIISDGITGLLIRAADSKQLQDAMLRMASEPNLRSTLADAAYERVRSVYTVDNTAQRIRDIYENILAS